MVCSGGVRVLTFVRSCPRWAILALAVVGAVLVGGPVQAQSGLDAALSRVKLTDLSAKTCDPKAVWRIEIVDPNVMVSWNSLLDTVNPIIRKLMYDGCNGIATFVADIQFKGRRIAATPGTMYPEEDPRKYIRDPAVYAEFEKHWIAMKKAEDAARTVRMKEEERIQEEKDRLARLEAAPRLAEEARKAEQAIVDAMQIGVPVMAPYHVRECHRAEAKPRSPANLTARDICEAIFRAGLSKPDMMVYAVNVSCQVTHKKGEIPLARCRYDYDVISDPSKRQRTDPAAEAGSGFLRLMGFGNTLDRVTGRSVLAGSANFGMPTLFYFDILKKQWESNGNQLKAIYENQAEEIKSSNREARSKLEYDEAKERCAEKDYVYRHDCLQDAHRDYLKR